MGDLIETMARLREALNGAADTIVMLKQHLSLFCQPTDDIAAFIFETAGNVEGKARAALAGGKHD